MAKKKKNPCWKGYEMIGMKKKKAIRLAIKKNAMPVLSSTFTTIAAFVPLLLLPGSIGKIMFALPLKVIIAISFSYIVEMIVTPVLGAMLYKKKNGVIGFHTTPESTQHHKQTINSTRYKNGTGKKRIAKRKETLSSGEGLRNWKQGVEKLTATMNTPTWKETTGRLATENRLRTCATPESQTNGRATCRGRR